MTLIIDMWPLWLFLLGLVMGVAVGWSLSSWAISATAKSNSTVYLRGQHYRLFPVDRELELEADHRRRYGTMAEQGW